MYLIKDYMTNKKNYIKCKIKFISFFFKWKKYKTMYMLYLILICLIIVCRYFWSVFGLSCYTFFFLDQRIAFSKSLIFYVVYNLIWICVYFSIKNCFPFHFLNITLFMQKAYRSLYYYEGESNIKWNFCWKAFKVSARAFKPLRMAGVDVAWHSIRRYVLLSPFNHHDEWTRGSPQHFAAHYR